ncbi:MAG: hypothetical protein IPI32_01135 [Austwickia sp.]|jgi:hypothetical protein|nr:hypothetical protein [Austwickia sp.]MBK8437565.1 hypothetical protein [Austwickia sp.]MBK9102831.1 hypothetical protein [Austwickia sp.]
MTTRRRITASRWIMPVVALVLMFGTYGVTKATGTWVSSGRTAIEHGTPLKPTELRGWMTLQQVSDGTGASLETLRQLIGAPDGVAWTPATQLRELESLVPGFSVAALRERLAAPAPNPTTRQP